MLEIWNGRNKPLIILIFKVRPLRLRLKVDQNFGRTSFMQLSQLRRGFNQREPCFGVYVLLRVWDQLKVRRVILRALGHILFHNHNLRIVGNYFFGVFLALKLWVPNDLHDRIRSRVVLFISFRLIHIGFRVVRVLFALQILRNFSSFFGRIINYDSLQAWIHLLMASWRLLKAFIWKGVFPRLINIVSIRVAPPCWVSYGFYLRILLQSRQILFLSLRIHRLFFWCES